MKEESGRKAQLLILLETTACLKMLNRYEQRSCATALL